MTSIGLLLHKNWLYCTLVFYTHKNICLIILLVVSANYVVQAEYHIIMTFWREASTVIFALRPCLAVGATKLSSSLSRVTDYKILMVKRSAESQFMPSKLVFPGGVVQDTDHSGDWKALFEKVMGRTLSDLIHQPSFNFSNALLNNWTLPPDVAYRICAIRETFEESGLLLATNRDLLSSGKPAVVLSSSAELQKAADQRQKVEQKPEYFLQMCKDLDVVPDIWALHDWRNWLTPVLQNVLEPPAKPKRFNTMFYMCCVDSDDIPHPSADDAETTQAEVSVVYVVLQCIYNA